MTDMPLPAAPAAEKQLLGCALLVPECVADIARRLRPADFVDDANRAVYAVLLDLYRRGKPVDVPTLCDALRGSLHFTSGSPAAYLLEVGQGVVTAAHVDHYIDTVADRAHKRRLLALSDDIRSFAQNGKAAREILTDTRAALDDLEREAGGGRSRFNIISAAELATTQYNLAYHVDGVLAKGQPCILAAPRKTLKTSCLVDLSIALAAGGRFLGYFRVTDPCRVLLCSGESGAAVLQETALRICEAAGYSLSELSDFILTTDLPRFDDAAGLAEFERVIEAEGVQVVGIDPAYLCMPGGDAGNLFVVGELLRGISEVCQRQGVTLIIAHHTRKGVADPFGAPELEDIAWAGFQEFARQWILLGRRERYEPGTGLHRLWLSVGGSAGHGGLWALDVDEGSIDDPGGRRWAVTVNKPDEARGEAERRRTDTTAAKWQAQLDEDRGAVCRVMAKHPNGLTKTAIGERAGIPTRRWPKVFAAILDSGELVPCEVKVSNQKRPREGYRLAGMEAT